MISAALRGAKVIVDEKGTGTAAAAMAFEASAAPQAALAVIADAPSSGPSSTRRVSESYR